MVTPLHEGVLLPRVSMQVTIYENFLACKLDAFNELLRYPDCGVLVLAGATLSVQFTANQRRPAVPTDHSVRVGHVDYLEYEVVPKQLGL